MRNRRQSKIRRLAFNGDTRASVGCKSSSRTQSTFASPADQNGSPSIPTFRFRPLATLANITHSSPRIRNADLKSLRTSQHFGRAGLSARLQLRALPLAASILRVDHRRSELTWLSFSKPVHHDASQRGCEACCHCLAEKKLRLSKERIGKANYFTNQASEHLAKQQRQRTTITPLRKAHRSWQAVGCHHVSFATKTAGHERCPNGTT